MKLAVLEGPRKFTLRESSVPTPTKNQVLIRMAYTAICGSEHAAFLGIATSYPHYLGLKNYPVYGLGHEGSGVVERIGSEVRNFKEGDSVIPIGRYEEFFVVNENDLIHVPNSLLLESAALTLMTSETLFVARLGRIDPEDSVAIFGMGPFGLLLLEHMRNMGCEKIIAVDLVESRLDMAEKLGAGVCVNPMKEDPVNKILLETKGKGSNVVYDTTGLSIPLKQAFKCVAPFGKVMVSGRPYQALNDFQIEDVFHKNIQVIGCLAAPEAYNKSAYMEAANLIKEGKIHADELITHVYPLEKIQEAFETATGAKSSCIKILISGWTDGKDTEN